MDIAPEADVTFSFGGKTPSHFNFGIGASVYIDKGPKPIDSNQYVELDTVEKIKDKLLGE